MPLWLRAHWKLFCAQKRARLTIDYFIILYVQGINDKACSGNIDNNHNKNNSCNNDSNKNNDVDDNNNNNYDDNNDNKNNVNNHYLYPVSVQN